MDTLGEGSQVGTAQAKKGSRTIKRKRDIVEEPMVLRASVARMALRRDVNANQIFYRLKPFREGRLGISMNPQLLRVNVEAEQRLAILGQGDAATVAFSLRLAWREFGKLPEQELPQQSMECHAPNKFRNRNSTAR